MDNLGFQQDLEEAAFTISDNSNHIGNSSGNPRLLQGRHISGQYSHQTPKLSTSSSLNLPKNKSSNKYRRFSESFSSDCRVPQRARNGPSSTASYNKNCDKDTKISCDITIIENDFKNCQRRFSDDSEYVGNDYFMSTPKRHQNPLDEFRQNNLKTSTEMSFHDPVLNNVQEILSVPSLYVNNSFLNSTPSISTRDSSSFNKINIKTETSIDILKKFPPSPVKHNNKNASSSYLNNMMSPENPSSLMNHHKFSDDSLLNSFKIKSQNNVNEQLNRSTTLPTATTKNHKYFQEESSGIRTVSGTIPMCYPGYKHPSPRPCAENRQNMRRSSKILLDNCEMIDRKTRLKRRSTLRGWKLQFIPSDHSKRRKAALCCVLFLACALVLSAAGIIVYMSTAMKSVPMKLDTTCEEKESEVNVVGGEFRIVNEKYEPILKDEKSAHFKQLATQIMQQLDILFSVSSLSLHYNHSHVLRLSHGFGKTGSGGIQVRCKLILTSTPPHGEAANLAGLEFLRGLRHHQGQMWLGNFIIDVQSIGFVAIAGTESTSTEPPDPVLTPGWSAWSSWGQCTANTQLRTRVCRLNMGSGVILTSIEPCLLLDHPGGDLEVRDCQHNESVVSSRVLDEPVTMQSVILKRTTDVIRNTTDTETSRNVPTIPIMEDTMAVQSTT